MEHNHDDSQGQCAICAGMTREQLIAESVERVKQFGHTFMHISADPDITPAPGYMYTIGLSHTRKWPELVISGDTISPTLLQHILDSVIKRWETDGVRYGEMPDLLHCTDGGMAPVQLVRVDPVKAAENHTCLVEDVFPLDDPYEVVQVLWSDQNRKFPGDPEYSLPPEAQELLHTN